MMTGNNRMRTLVWPLMLVAFLAMAGLACGSLGGPYEETFDSLGSWGSGSDGDVEGNVQGGAYRLHVIRDTGIFWATGAKEFGDGTYEVEATQVDGPLDNGYGLMFRVEDDPDGSNDSYYLLEVSGDGFIWMGACLDGCSTAETLIVFGGGAGWIESPAVRTGLNNTNRLKVIAEGANLTFFVNDQQVGQATDTSLAEGDIGVLVETLGEGGVVVQFDNFRVTPLDD